MSAHTPKPWHKPHDDSPHWKSGRAIPVCSKDGYTVAKVGSIRHEQRANVDLITAAPEMLEALKTVRWALEDGTLVDKDRDPEGNDIFCIVDKMIFKAEGGQEK